MNYYQTTNLIILTVLLYSLRWNKFCCSSRLFVVAISALNQFLNDQTTFDVTENRLRNSLRIHSISEEPKLISEKVLFAPRSALDGSSNSICLIFITATNGAAWRSVQNGVRSCVCVFIEACVFSSIHTRTIFCEEFQTCTGRMED